MTDAGFPGSLSAPDAPAGPTARGGFARVGLATVITAVCGYAVLYLAARRLEPAGFALFAVFWGAFGLVTGATNGLLQEAAREVRLVGPIAAEPPRRTRPMLVAAGVGIMAAAVIVGTSRLWARFVFAEDQVLSVGFLAFGLAGFCFHATLLGLLAGTGRWTPYSSLMVADAAIRLALATAAYLSGWGLAGFLWATVGGSVAWILLLVMSAGTRAAARLSTPVAVPAYLRGALHSITAAGASAILVMGFPVLLKATSTELGAAGGVVILAVTLTRAPLLVPLTAMQGNLVVYFVEHRGQRLRSLLSPAGAILVIGAAGVLAAALVGPWLLRTGFGADYSAGSALLAWLTAGAVCIALLTLTGAATVAAALHRAYAAGWVGATVVATLLLTLPLDLHTRTIVALLCGPLVGIGVHMAALARAG